MYIRRWSFPADEITDLTLDQALKVTTKSYIEAFFSLTVAESSVSLRFVSETVPAAVGRKK